MKKFKKYVSIAVLGSTLLTVACPAMVEATENSGHNYQQSDNVINHKSIEGILSFSDIQKVDRFIQVYNNEFVLKKSINSNISYDVYTLVERILNQTNEYVKEHGLIINSATKTIEPDNTFRSKLMFNYVDRSASSKNSKYTYKQFWWGTRYYFRSNNAVYQMEHELDTSSLLVGTLANLLTSGFGAAVGFIGAAYFQKIKSDLYYMNNTHPHDYLYMDVNLTGIYKIEVLK